MSHITNQGLVEMAINEHLCWANHVPRTVAAITALLDAKDARIAELEQRRQMLGDGFYLYLMANAWQLAELHKNAVPEYLQELWSEYKDGAEKLAEFEAQAAQAEQMPSGGGAA